MSVLRCVLLGAGNFGRHYARLLQTIEGVALESVVVHQSAAGDVRAALGIPSAIEVSTDAAAALGSSRYDCAIIATSPATHFALAEEALARGMHVLVEKPMVTSVEDARALAHAAEISGKVCMVGYQYLFHDAIRYIREELIERGVRFTHLFVEHALSPPRPDVNVLWDVAPHALSILHYLFGAPRIGAVHGSLRAQEGGTLPGTVAMTMCTENGPSLTLASSWYGREKKRRLTFLGEGMRVLFDESLAGGPLLICRDGVAPQVPAFDAREPLRRELDHFFACARSGARPLTDVSFGRRITEELAELESRLDVCAF
ncbi:MAG: Gfo/Idh/MocA family oxidoreductase [bacterium]|nr:Gfo/Idh/MocA family oxidoreductase [bacterium]MDZ4285102.1 Gfo/Idh/MocA family oxidoreductase [Patescibacteria group bacterium]